MTTNRNYANRNLQNISFKGQDLCGGDFSGSDLRGCDFTGANLVGASFEKVKTGQSRRQVIILIIAAIVSPLILFAFSLIVAQFYIVWFSDRSNQVVNLFSKVLPILALIVGNFIRGNIASRFPKVTVFLNIAAIAVLFAVMVTLTVSLAVVGVVNFSDGTIVAGFFLLLLMIVSALLTFRIFNWLLEAIESYPGTSFRKSNLTDANFSHSVIRNTDFSFAILTGVCIFNWTVEGHVQFTKVFCKYIYLDSIRQNRQPTEGNFQPDELARVLTQSFS